MRIARAPGQRGHRRRLPGDTTLAEAAHLLIGQLVPLRTTGDGRLLGWYRLGNEKGPLPAHADLESLDDEETYSLWFIENTVLWVRVEVEGGRWTLPLATAVPVASVLDALCLQLGLAEGSWQLLLSGVVLDDYDILADYTLGTEPVLTVRRAP